MTTHIIFDTDIGTDVDDALALALIMGSDDLSMECVTTVYGDTRLRARLAAKLISLGSKGRIPIFSGERATLSGREVWWPGHEGTQFSDLTKQHIDGDDAVEHIAQSILRSSGKTVLLAVGPLTNIAQLIRRYPQVVHAIRMLYIMGGDFSDENRIIEHNFKCDAVAAAEVFASGVPITVTGLDVTEQIALRSEQVDNIRHSGSLGEALGAEIDIFWNFHGKPWNNPHDAITALVIARPDLFDFVERRVRIDVDEHPGLVHDDVSGVKVLVATNPRVEEIIEEIVCRITRADG